MSRPVGPVWRAVSLCSACEEVPFLPPSPGKQTRDLGSCTASTSGRSTRLSQQIDRMLTCTATFNKAVRRLGLIFNNPGSLSLCVCVSVCSSCSSAAQARPLWHAPLGSLGTRDILQEGTQLQAQREVLHLNKKHPRKVLSAPIHVVTVHPVIRGKEMGRALPKGIVIWGK